MAAIEAAEARRDRLTAQIEAMLPDWTLASVVAALQTMRGMALVNAATLIAELGDLSRFANARQLMAYLGLVPCEYSSGASVKRGGLTKAGNKAARRLLIEAPGVTASRPGSAASCGSGRRSSRGRSARSPGKRNCGFARAIANSPAVASRPMSSPPRSPASWRASSGPLPGACRRRWADRNKRVIASRGGASEPRDMLLPGKAGGTAAVRRTLVSTICRVADPTLVARPRQLRDASTVMRFRPAHQSMINRRHDGRASRFARQSLQQMLERKPRIYLPATCKGGHERLENIWPTVPVYRRPDSIAKAAAPRAPGSHPSEFGAAVLAGFVLYSVFSTKSLSAPDSAPQTSPLRPASCRAPV